MGKLEKHLVLPVLLLAVCATNAFKTPIAHKNHQNALDGSRENIAQWHGLDYEYGMFDHSQEDKKNLTKEETSNKTSSSKFVASFEYSDSDESWWGSSYEDDYSDEQQHHDIITIGNQDATTPKETEKVEETTQKRALFSTKAASKLEPSAPQERGKGKEVDYNWDEDEGDEDDGLGEKSAEKKVSDLPTDNDRDVDKYFNPDRYQDQLTLHQIEDHLTRTWTVQYEETRRPCIMLRGDIKLIVPVNPAWFNRDHVEIDVPQSAVASGTCNSLNNDYQEIILKWNVSIPERGKKYQNSVYFGFATNWTSEYSEMSLPKDKYALVAVTVVYYNGEIGNGDDGLVSYSVSDLIEYVTPLNMSMSCFKDNQRMIVGDMQLTLSNMQMEAFRPNLETLTAGEFSRSVLCASDEVYVFDAVMTYIIWFWIGALLVVLLIFVVLLSLGYRRRRFPEDNGGFGYKILSA